MFRTSPLIPVVLLLFISGCYLPRTMPEETSVVIHDESEISLSGSSSPTYLYNYSGGEYASSFFNELTSELQENNIRVIAENEQKADFSVSIRDLNLEETIETETVNDEDSEYDGVSYKKSNCKGSLQVELFKGNKEKGLRSWNVSVLKDEDVTNNRNLTQMIVGSNKDKNTYRLKTLDDDIFMDIMERLADKVSARVTTKMYRVLK